MLLLNNGDIFFTSLHQKNGLTLIRRGMKRIASDSIVKNTVKNILEPKKCKNPTWIAHEEEKVNICLTSIKNSLSVIKEKGNLIAELSALQKIENIEVVTQARLFTSMSKESFWQKDMFDQMIDCGSAINNIYFSEAALDERVGVSKFFEIKLASDFGKRNGCQMAMYGEQEIPVSRHGNARQSIIDGYFKFGLIERGFDLKFGKIKDQGTSVIYPIYLQNNKNIEIANQLNLLEYFEKKIKTFNNVISDLKEKNVYRPIFEDLEKTLRSNAPLEEKFHSINNFSKILLLNKEIHFTGECIQIYEHFQNSQDIDKAYIQRFLELRKAYNADTLNYLQYCIADFIKAHASDEIIDLLIKTKKRRNPKFMEMVENSIYGNGNNDLFFSRHAV